MAFLIFIAWSSGIALLIKRHFENTEHSNEYDRKLDLHNSYSNSDFSKSNEVSELTKSEDIKPSELDTNLQKAKNVSYYSTGLKLI